MAAIAKIFLDGADQSSSFDLVSLHAHEQLGRCYALDAVLLADKASLSPAEVLGKSLGVALTLQDGVKRCFNGIVFRMSRGPRQGHRHEYRVHLQPDFALLGLRSDARVFQNKTVLEVFETVVAQIPSLAWQFSASSLPHLPWENCVQYQETDLSFLLRLLEHEGIYFYFEHLEGGQTRMKLLDTVAGGAQKSLSFNPNAAASKRPHDYAEAWSRTSKLVPGVAELSDFDFTKPMQQREVRSAQPAGHTHDAMELYFYPGEFDSRQEGATFADLRMQALHVEHASFEGRTSSPDIAIGKTIGIQQHPADDLNGDYLVVSTSYSILNRDPDAGGGGGASIECHFTAIPAKIPYRPERITPKSMIFGPQTAFVVGPENNEIHTDEHGRIRVQFHWDRYGKPTQDTSCWIRVAQPWANQGFGFWALPRVGSEVVVQFLDGDPDRPLAVGSVYNGENRIPYPQPANKTRSGVRTLSTPEGGINDFNELRFEDKKGEEEIYLQAQKDLNTRVKADATCVVGGEDKLSVEKGQNIRVSKGRELTVAEIQVTSIGGDHKLAVAGNQACKVDGDRTAQLGSDSVQVQGDAVFGTGGDLGITTGQNYALNAQLGIAMSAQTTVDLKSGMTIAMDASAGLSLRCGGSFISLTPAGIFIQAPMLMLNSGGSALNAKAARPAKAKPVQKPGEAGAISVADSPPVVPATRQPRAGSLADAARTGSPFAEAG
ncbi:type VI secretion system Vgr family protein [Noviherbaspirillum sp.]|uniref:type VI secretion system Vgr family protein n=1 Tax=Noviherbaspirillum sp. TaxID=1926288 RepID=UPI002D23C076|nr:type VI secretion system tip protein TssI/VgrG [Noviherbaspirillum sp.]HZW19952.1 type VI secretion system tip protein TssI/VgrG [Noviherbaspirillum sp.]